MADGFRPTGRNLGRDSFVRALNSIDNLNTGVSSPLSYTTRDHASGANSLMNSVEIHGASTVQVSGFDF